MRVSECCGAYTEYDEIGLCPECMEHCEFVDDEEEEEDFEVEDLRDPNGEN